MKKIISLIGTDGSGKSTSAKILKKIIEDSGKTVEIVSFATPLKIIAERNCGYEEEKKRNGHRDILLKLGSDIRENLGNEVFAYACLDKISDMPVDYVIIDDMRWYIEAELLGAFIPTIIVEISSEGFDTDTIFENFKNELIAGEFKRHIIPNYKCCDITPIIEDIFEEIDG